MFCSCIVCFVVLGPVSSVLSQETGWEEPLQNNLFCIKWDVKSNQSVNLWMKIGIRKVSEISVQTGGEMS